MPVGFKAAPQETPWTSAVVVTTVRDSVRPAAMPRSPRPVSAVMRRSARCPLEGGHILTVGQQHTRRPQTQMDSISGQIAFGLNYILQ